MELGRNEEMPNYISIKVCDKLFKLIAKDADKSGKGMIDICVAALAAHYGKPDLGYVPRKTPGRRRSNQVAPSA